jgi:hypothetical protein
MNTGLPVPGVAYAPASLDPEAMMAQYKNEMNPRPWNISVHDPRIEEFMYQYLKEPLGGYRFLTLHEAFYGSEELGVEPMARDTSCGFGLSRFWKDKDELLSRDPTTAVFMCHWDWQNALDPKRVEVWLTKGSLKDELRKMEKVVTKATRVFTASPFVYTVAERRQLGDLCAKFYRCAATHTFFGAIGEDYFNGGWDKMLRWITRNGLLQNLLDADIKEWDKSHEHFWRMCNIMLYIRLCCEADAMKVFTYHEFRVNLSPIVAGALGHMLFSKIGYGSGRGDTAINNCISNLRVHVTAFFRICQRYDLDFTPDNFDQWYRVKICGDDNGCALPATIKGRPLDFGMDDLISLYAEFGWRCVPNGQWEGFTPLLEFEFAGRKSIYVDAFGQYWPVIPIVRIVEIVRHARKLDPAIRLQRAEAAAFMAFPYLWHENEAWQLYAVALLAYYYLTLERMAVYGTQSFKTMTDFCKIYSGMYHVCALDIREFIFRVVENIVPVLKQQLIRYI